MACLEKVEGRKLEVIGEMSSCNSVWHEKKWDKGDGGRTWLNIVNALVTVLLSLDPVPREFFNQPCP